MSTKLTHIMNDYLDEQENSRNALLNESVFNGKTIPQELPLQPVDISEWEIISNPRRFKRTFEFMHMPALRAFLNEIMDHQEEVGHHAKIILEQMKVTVEVYTHGVNDITELDQEYVQALDNIHKDIDYYFVAVAEDKKIYDI